MDKVEEKARLRKLVKGDLADEFGKVKAIISKAKAMEELLKTEIARRGIRRVDGELFTVTRSPADKEVLDQDALEKKFGKEAVAKCMKTTHYWITRVSSRTTVPKKRTRRTAGKRAA
jgi:hypothetical protein